VPEAQANAALAAMRSVPGGRDARVVGRATAAHPGRVAMPTGFGSTRVVDMLVDEQPPRIC
jgi:hydrogenase expression/formation protein HypE